MLSPDPGGRRAGYPRVMGIPFEQRSAEVVQLGAADATLRRPEVSARVVLPLIHLLREKHGEERVDDVILAAGLDPVVMKDTEAWVSMVFLARLRDAILSQLYDLDTPPPRDHAVWQLYREAGIVGFDRKLLGGIWPVLRAFGSPGLLYRQVPREVRLSNTVLEARVIDDTPGRVVLSMRPIEPGYAEGVDSCWNRIGVFEGIPRIWGLATARVEHPRCMHDPAAPADACEYVVHFKERTLARAARTGATVVAGGGLALLAGAALATPLPVAFGVGALLGLGAEGWRRTLALQRAQEDDKARVRALLERADQRYLDLWTESEELRRLTLDNRNIATYLPKELVDRLRGTQQAPRLGGAKREVTVLFTDLRSYSTISEHLDPDDVIRLLNDCFGALVADVESHGGTVLEFLGDGMLAVFGAPGHQPDHAVQAVRCVQAMVRSLERLNDTWALTGRDRLWTEQGIPEVGFRAGLHTGTVVAGNLGTERHMKYTIVGDAVNLAARLEQLNKELGTTVAMSEQTRARLPPELQAWAEPMGAHHVKGRAQPVTVYTHEPAPHG